MALDLPPPRQILSHAHWTLGNKKMSKSTGNVVNPFFALERFGADTMRYYMAFDGGIKNDTDYGNLTIIERYKKGLQGGIGNLASRITRGKGWNVREAVQLASRGELPRFDPFDLAQVTRLRWVAFDADKAVEELDVGSALRGIISMIFAVKLSSLFLGTFEPMILKAYGFRADEQIYAIPVTLELSTFRD